MLIKVPEVFAALDLRLWAVISFGMKKCSTSKSAGRGVWIGGISTDIRSLRDIAF